MSNIDDRVANNYKCLLNTVFETETCSKPFYWLVSRQLPDLLVS